MGTPTIAPFGSWRSPISVDLLVADTVRLGGVGIDAGHVYWLEGRPREGGRNVLVRRAPDGTVHDLTPPGFDVRTRVHEYGGGAWLACGEEVLFCNFADERIYRQRVGEAPRALTAPGAWRYADLVLDGARRRLVCVREDHTETGREPVNDLVAVSLAGGEVTPLARGHDFHAAPAPSPDGRRLAYLTWDHPDMPWDAAALWVADVGADGALGPPQRVAGGADCSVLQPRWAPDGTLYLVADPGGWWNLHRWRDGRVECLREVPAEFGRALWQLGTTTYGLDARGDLVCAYCERGRWSLARLGAADGAWRRLDLPFTSIDDIAVEGSRAVMLAGSPTTPAAVVSVDLDGGGIEVLRSSSRVTVDAGCLSCPQPIEFATGDGERAHGFYYPPANTDHRAPPGERPPLIVASHGGPTGSTSTTLDLRLQFWTSRGFAVLDVNYRGSTGYGRAYRDRLRGEWGVVDVEDCVNGARHLVDLGAVDGARLAIRGGSAGGYTTLAALTFHDCFAAGASHYGIGDLEALARDTHKFESRYLDRLVGPYPEMRDRYRERSPIHAVDRLRCPVIFFQGLEDRVVPPNQAEAMVAALERRGLPVAYLAFEGEQHGFRKAETIKRVLEAELYFYGRIFGFDPAGEIAPVEIVNAERIAR